MDNTIETILSKYLPNELIHKILITHKGLVHPTANIINQYWEMLDNEYNIYLNIDLVVHRKYIEYDVGCFTITTEETYNEIFQDYPRFYFEPEFDVIETIMFDDYDYLEDI
tara:strand:+ start:11351 stop:11683 length:333 start_codon:yes stop_codon:yes gene_type:complete